MPVSIQLTADSRLVKASDFKAPGPPVDFAKDHVVILGDDARPVAECRPIGRTNHPDKKAKATPKPAPAVAAKPTPAPARSEENGYAANGRLTEGQREMLTRLWVEHPKLSPGQIGEMFERQAGRTISPLTVNAYKPA